MKKNLDLKNIVSLAWTGLISNFFDWFYLLGMKIMSIFGLILFCALAYAFNYFLLANNFIIFITLITIFVMSLFTAVLTYPIMSKQNALDAAFDRNLSGYKINNRFLSYMMTMFLYWLLVIVTTPMFFLGFFLAQRLRFAGLHILEHGCSIKDAFKTSWNMTQGYVWIFICISFIQWFILAFCTCTILPLFPAIAFCDLMETNMYKKLYEEQNISDCSSCNN